MISDQEGTPWTQASQAYLYGVTGVRKGMGSSSITLDASGLRGGGPVQPGSFTISLRGEQELMTSTGAFRFSVKPGSYKIRTSTVRGGLTICGVSKLIHVTAGSEVDAVIRMGGGTVIQGRIELQLEDPALSSLSGFRVFVGSSSYRKPEDLIPTLETHTDETGHWKIQFPVALSVDERIVANVQMNAKQRNEMEVTPTFNEGTPSDFFHFVITKKKVVELFDGIKFDYTGIPLPLEVSRITPQKRGGSDSPPSGLRALLELIGGTEVQDPPLPDQIIENPNARAVISVDDGDGQRVLFAHDVVLKSGINEFFCKPPISEHSFVITLTSERGVARVPLKKVGKTLSASFAGWEWGNTFSGSIIGPVAEGDEVHLRLANDTRGGPYATTILDRALSFEFKLIPSGTYYIRVRRPEPRMHFYLDSDLSSDERLSGSHDSGQPSKGTGNRYERVRIQGDHFKNYRAREAQ